MVEVVPTTKLLSTSLIRVGWLGPSIVSQPANSLASCYFKTPAEPAPRQPVSPPSCLSPWPELTLKRRVSQPLAPTRTDDEQVWAHQSDQTHRLASSSSVKVTAVTVSAPTSSAKLVSREDFTNGWNSPRKLFTVVASAGPPRRTYCWVAPQLFADHGEHRVQSTRSISPSLCRNKRIRAKLAKRRESICHRRRKEGRGRSLGCYNIAWVRGDQKSASKNK